jgi:hypothetical protein
VTASSGTPTRSGALRAYQDQRLPATGELVVRNRAGGPERVIDEVDAALRTGSAASTT